VRAGGFLFSVFSAHSACAMRHCIDIIKIQAQQRNVIKHLGFSPHDTLVWVVGTDSASSASSNEDCDKKGFIRSVLFSPWDLPFLMTGHGASKHLSQIEPAGVLNAKHLRFKRALSLARFRSL
jgi:hypothetical protein